MPSILRGVSRRFTSQTERAKASQVQNSAGGYVFAVERLAHVKRFLILGTEGGTFYADAKNHTLRNVTVLEDALAADGKAVVDLIVDVSVRGLAPKTDPVIFALAMASAADDDDTRVYALSKLSDVCRTATHLFSFLSYRKQFRGVGRGLRTAVSRWYTDKPVDKLAYQVAKYRNREGNTHRDVLRIAHPKTDEAARKAVFEFAARGSIDEHTPRVIEGFAKAQEMGADVPELVREYALSWDMLPDAALMSVATWDALLDVGIPQTALMRQLPRLTRLGVLKPLGGRTNEVIEQLTNPERLRAARLHPLQILLAGKTYASGRGASATWAPVPKIVDALDEAFYAAFHTVEAAGKRTLVALDVSASMSWATHGPLSACEVGAALSMVVAASEPESHIVGFADKIRDLGITPKMRLNEAMRRAQFKNFGATNAALAMQYASKRGLAVDTFVTVTDNETWRGDVHPFQALKQYRAQTGIDAKLVSLGVTATGFTIADPSDAGMLDIAGFSADVPTLITEFSKGF